MQISVAQTNDKEDHLHLDLVHINIEIIIII